MARTKAAAAAVVGAAKGDGRGKGKTEQDPRALMRARLAESGLAELQAKRLGLEALSASQVGSGDGRPAMRIPYFSPSGKQTEFYRVRYLGEPRGWAASAAKPPRYWQPKKSLNEVYLPPLLKQPWAEVLKDPSTPLIITEGEIKAAVACSKGLACIGLGGVEVFHATKRGFPDLLPVLAEAKWAQRSVAIIWDSDVGTKPAALAAQLKLAYTLAQRGAVPKLLALPPSGAAKVGLDDYLLTHSVDDLQALVDAAPVYEEAKALWEMNEEVVFIQSPPLIVRRSDNELISYRDFQNATHANRKFTARDAEGKVKQKPTAKAWLEWPSRFELKRLAYAPGEEQVTKAAEWNLWSGWGVEAVEGDVQPFLDLVAHIFKDAEPGAKEWFLKWAAYPLQHPGTKLFTAVVIWGATHGTGKSLLGYTLRDLYGKNASTVGDEDIHGSFNEWAKYKQFVVGEEITGSDKKADSARLKAMITRETINLNAKYLPVITLPDCINYFFTSNEPNAFFLQDTDRRFFIMEVKGAPLPLAFYKAYEDWRLRQGGLRHLRHFLEHVDLTGFNPHGPAMETQAKRDMIVDNKSDLGRWVHELKEDPARILRMLGNAKAAESCALFTATQLFKLFNPLDDARKGTINGFGRELKAAGFDKYGRPGFKADSKGNCHNIRTNAGTQAFWMIRDAEKWSKASPADVAAHWEGYFCKPKY